MKKRFYRAFFVAAVAFRQPLSVGAVTEKQVSRGDKLRRGITDKNRGAYGVETF